MPELTDDARSVAGELGRCRWRGIEDLDHDTHNQKPVEAPMLDSLAERYCAATAPHLRGRVGRIKHLLRRALAAYEQDGNVDDARLISDLFFGDATDRVQQSAGELRRRARKKWREPNDARFRDRSRRAFRAFADYLVEFAATGNDRETAASQQQTTGTDKSEAAYRPQTLEGRTLHTAQLAAILRFSLDDPGGTGNLTIDEHQRIITERGACWWGWFKAAHDDDHSQAMAQRLGGCEIGLWERSEGDCFVARCEEVRVADGADMPSPDASLTPAYYRRTEWPAWLKLTAISPSSRGDLAERFGDLPETRATIYWNPEPAREPIVIPAHGRSILHLSGLRFGKHHRWSTASAQRPSRVKTEEAIAHVLELQDIDPAAIGVVVICGNFVCDEPTEAAYNDALAFLDGLCDELPHVRPDNVTIVPGADDFARPGDQARASQTLYREFHRQLYGGDSETDITRLRQYQFADFHMNVLPVNTVKMLGTAERDEGMFGQGYDGQLSVMARDYKRSGAEGRRVINVVAAHHHLVPTLVKLPELAAEASVRERLMPGIHDARDVLEKLAVNRVRLFLHGHLHQPDFLFISSDDGWQTAVCGAGTAGAAEGWLREKYRSHHENALAIYDIEDTHIAGRMFRFDEDFHRSPAVKHFRIADQFVKGA